VIFNFRRAGDCRKNGEPLKSAMAIKDITIKRLFAKSQNRCARPGCKSHLVLGEQVLAEICHIRARQSGGPRFDPALSAEDKDSFANLLLLCGTCHTLVDKDPKTWTVELLTEIKEIHERNGETEINTEIAREAMLILNKYANLTVKSRKRASAMSSGQGVAIAVGGDNHAPITVNASSRRTGTYYPPNSIGADANLTNYIDYLCELYVKFMQPIDTDEGRLFGKLGKQIKKRFHLAKRTRNHLPSERFHDLVNFLVHEKLPLTPVGRKHVKKGTRMYLSFEEFRSS
jgi:hypothetical protein